MSGIAHGQTALPFARLNRFDFMFRGLQGVSGALLPKSSQSVEDLKSLAESMSETSDSAERDSAIPAAYTYFGQFLDHEITLDNVSKHLAKLDDPNLVPTNPDVIRQMMVNSRSPRLDLDSVYGPMPDGSPVPRDGDHLVLGKVSPAGKRPAGKDDYNDLKRKASSTNPDEDREALIGDPRNDEHLIIAQFHVAMIRAHNALVSQGHSFNEAKKLLQQHFQWLVIHDFLMRVADPEIVAATLKRGHNRFYKPAPYDLYMPLEFSVAAFRFGHSLVRSSYHINKNFPNASLGQLFALSAHSGNLNPAPEKSFPTLPENWIIEWGEFLDGGSNRARRIDSNLADPLFELSQTDGSPLPDQPSLAARNLLRGYQLRIPTGQAVAVSLGLPVMTPTNIEKSVTDAQAKVLRRTGFSTRTPLWYYVLVENADTKRHLPDHLGPVGSTIVVEVLIELIRQSTNSILCLPDWRPTIGSKLGIFMLRDLLALADVL